MSNMVDFAPAYVIINIMSYLCEKGVLINIFSILCIIVSAICARRLPVSGKSSRGKRIIKGIAGTLAVATAVSIGTTDIVCSHIFKRVEPQKNEPVPVDGVAAAYEDVGFLSGGVRLRGWLYSVEAPKALAIMVHGFRDDQGCFSLLVQSFTENGFSVLTFDGTAAGTSDGDSIVGMEQARYDTLAALDYVNSRGDTAGVPVVLFGYSMGAYGVLTAMNDVSPAPAAVVAVAGYNATTDLMVGHAQRYISVFANLGRPFLWLRDYMNVGADAGKTAAEALEAANMPVLLIQGAEDQAVPYELSAYGRGIISGNANISYMLVEAEGHADHSGVLPRSDDGSGAGADEAEKSQIDAILRFITDSLKRCTI